MKPHVTALERDLLTAALAQDGREIAAFERFMANFDFDGPVDSGHFRMFPLMYANLTRAGVAAGRLGRFRGVYKFSWCKTHEIFARASEAVAALQRHGVPVMASKGIVLARRYYDNPAHRPMSDMDLVVPVDRARDAVSALKSIGYVPKIDAASFSDGHYADYLVSRHSEDLRRGADEIDLHWYVMRQCRSAAANRRFWANAEAIELSQGVAAKQLRPDDMLMHVVVHGLQWNPMSPLRWIADAAMILRRAGGTMNWDALFDAAAALKIEGHFRAGLEYLRTLDLVELPVWPRKPRVTLAERAERWAHGKPFAVNLVIDAIRLASSDARYRIPRLAGKWAARRIGAL